MKTIDECKDEVAKKHGYNKWDDIFWRYRDGKINSGHLTAYWDESTRLYASQFQQPTASNKIVGNACNCSVELKDRTPLELKYRCYNCGGIVKQNEVSPQPPPRDELPSDKDIESQAYISHNITDEGDADYAEKQFENGAKYMRSLALSVISKKSEEIAEKDAEARRVDLKHKVAIGELQTKYEKQFDIIDHLQKQLSSQEEEKKVEAIKFLESIRDYERESGQRICFDERTSEELYEEFFKQQNHNVK